MSLRWRQVYESDESWVLEQKDPSFKKNGSDTKSGWRPLAFIWQWADLGCPRPWRGGVADEKGRHIVNSNREYKTLKGAFTYMQKRTKTAQTTPAVVSL